MPHDITQKWKQIPMNVHKLTTRPPCFKSELALMVSNEGLISSVHEKAPVKSHARNSFGLVFAKRFIGFSPVSEIVATRFVIGCKIERDHGAQVKQSQEQIFNKKYVCFGRLFLFCFSPLSQQLTPSKRSVLLLQNFILCPRFCLYCLFILYAFGNHYEKLHYY